MHRIKFQPLINFNDDKLGFTNQCSNITNFIETFPNDQPYSIALFGSWGSGKSTMLNFIESQLNKERNIIIRFNPWQILNEVNLVPTLFEEISYSIKNKEFVKLKKNLLNYGRKICGSSSKLISSGILRSHGVNEQISDSISEVMSNTVDTIFNSDDPEPISIKKTKLEQELIKWSTKENKKIVVFIDEIDRLFPADIIEIFKVIKVAVSFPSIIFIVAMDREAVNDSLSSLNISRPEEYLSKIFQQKFYINSNFQLRTLFRELLIPLIDIFPDPSKDNLLKSIEAVIFLNEKYLFLPTKNITDQVQNKAKLIYYEVYITLSIPRMFVNFTSFVLTNWVNYYNQLSEKGVLSDKDNIAVFIIFTLYFIHPELVENHILGSRTNEDRVDYPLLFKNLFDILFEATQIPVEGQPNTHKLEYNDRIISRAIYTLKKYPDLRQYFD
jgi:predicted KAP-like P-loop ATPase